MSQAISDATVARFAQVQQQHRIQIKQEVRYDNLSTFICQCGVEFIPNQRTENDTTAHLVEAMAAAGLTIESRDLQA